MVGWTTRQGLAAQQRLAEALSEAVMACMQAFASSGQLRTLRQSNAVLEAIQARLDVYLGQKRRAFPRFHFISNPELLDVLSHTRDPSATQPHMRKLFEGAARLDLVGEGRTRDVLAMISAQHERLPLGKMLKARGAPEGLLTISPVMCACSCFEVHRTLVASEHSPFAAVCMSAPYRPNSRLPSPCAVSSCTCCFVCMYVCREYI